MLHSIQTALGSTKQRLRDALSEASRGDVTMQRRVGMYWGSMILVLLMAFFVLGSLLGVFNKSEERFEQALAVYHQDAVLSFREQVDILEAQSIALSNKVSLILVAHLQGRPVQSISDDVDRIADVELAAYSSMNAVLESSPCNGVFVILDATANTQVSNVSKSRACLYIRFANLSTSNMVNQDLVCYRGVADVARDKGVELHNRWRMEADLTLVEGFEQVVSQKIDSFDNSFAWSGSMELTDTWEKAFLLMVPLFAADGSVQGVCGVELGDLFMRLSYPARESEFGSMVTVIAPIENGALDLSRGITGELKSTYLSNDDLLYVKAGDGISEYEGQSGSYVGTHTGVDLDSDGTHDVYVATLVPSSRYENAVFSGWAKLVIAALTLLVAALALSITMSRRCVRPMSDALLAIRQGNLAGASGTGVSEIDSLVAFLDEQPKSVREASLPEDIQDLLEVFSKRYESLTATERTIAKMYGEGHEVHDVAETLVISIHTVRKHNANIYRKLDVGSREELILYLEIFRRCGRFEDLL